MPRYDRAKLDRSEQIVGYGFGISAARADPVSAVCALKLNAGGGERRTPQLERVCGRSVNHEARPVPYSYQNCSQK